MKPEQQRIAIAQACGWLIVNATAVPDRIWPSLNYVTGIDGPAMFPPVGYKTNGRKATGFIAMTPPDYLNDLNAMHEAEEILNDVQRIHFSTQIMHTHNAKGGRGCSPFDYGHATAAQRAEAFLRTLNLWTA